MSEAVIILSGGSTSGKNTLTTKLERNPLLLGRCCQLVVSATTRPPRNGEIEGKDYRFVSRIDFEEMIKDSKLLEYENVFGSFYGTPSDHVDILKNGKIPVFIVDPAGNVALSQLLSSQGYKVVSICLSVVNQTTLDRFIDRIENEGKLSEEQVQEYSKRIANSYFIESNWTEMVNYDLITSTGVNEVTLNNCIEQIQKAVCSNVGEKKLLISKDAEDHIKAKALNCRKSIETVISNRDNIETIKLKKLITKIIIRENNEQLNALGEEAFQPN